MVELTTNQKGFVVESAIIHEAAKRGITVLKPLDDARYDLALDLPNGLTRIQCKWAMQNGDVVVIRCRTCRRGHNGLIYDGYKPGEIDGIAAYCASSTRVTYCQSRCPSTAPLYSSASPRLGTISGR